MVEETRYILFSNRGYGAAFESAFQEWCTRHRVARALVVRSGRDAVAPRTLKSAVSDALRQFGGALGRATGGAGADEVLRVDDVNAASFREAVLPAGARYFGVVAGFNQIFGPESIGRFEELCNFHPSLLPYYRGPVPSYWCLRNGETRTGLTLHRVTERIDQGEILWQKVLPIEGADPDAIDRKLAALGAGMLPRLLDSFRTGTPFPVERVDAATVYTHHVDYRSFPDKQ